MKISTFKVVKDFTEIYFIYFQDEGGSPIEVLEFYKKYRCPLVGHLQEQNKKMYDRRPIVIVFYDVNFKPAVRSCKLCFDLFKTT